MSETTETLLNSELEALRASGVEVSDFKAVIRTKKADVLVVPGLGTFTRAEPQHTNDEELIEKALKAGGLDVTIDPSLYKTVAQRAAEEQAAADAKAKAKADADAKAKAKADADAANAAKNGPKA